MIVKSESPTSTASSGGQADLPAAALAARRAVNWRSILLGLIGVVLICGLTPYNDYVIANTYLVGNFLSIGLVLFFFLFCTLFNSLLWRMMPQKAMSGAELSVAMGMALVSCGLPSSGLMRYLPAQLVGMYNQAGSNTEAVVVLRQAKLPSWMLPSFGYTFESDETADGAPLPGQWKAPTKPVSTDPRVLANDPIISYFFRNIPQQQVAPGFWGSVKATPWAQWMRPAITWGLFTAAFFGAILAMMVIVRHQWVENERLPFPLASIYASLVESPEAGRMLNPLFRSPGFWISFGVVFVLHSINVLAAYHPGIFPKIPLRYDLLSLFADPPMSAMHWSIKTSTVYFCIVGITYFLQSSVAFSLWFMFVMVQVMRVILSSFNAELTVEMETDQLFGALIPFTLMTVWIGRAHWAMVLRQMVRGFREGETRGRYMSYPFAGWMLLACMVVMCLWLMAAGMTLLNAIGLIVMMLTLCLVLARVVAETGLVFVQIAVPTHHPWIVALQSGLLRQVADPASMVPSLYLVTSVSKIYSSDMREMMPVFASHALRLSDYYDSSTSTAKPRKSYGLTGVLVMALVIGFVIAGASTLLVEYKYGSTLSKTPVTPVNDYAINTVPRSMVGLVTQMRDNGGPPVAHNRYAHMALGAGITTALAVLRLRYLAWPLHPVGFLLCYSFPIVFCWFSIFLGWLLKALIVKFGGSSLYRQAKPWFMGMIVGEASVAAFWMIVSLILAALGKPYEAINLLPG